jgi:hypothetical protein
MKYLTLHRICKGEASRLSLWFFDKTVRNNSPYVFYDRFSDEEVLYQKFFELGLKTFKDWEVNKVEMIELGYLKDNGKKIYGYFNTLGTLDIESAGLLYPSAFNDNLVDSIYISLTTNEDEI